MNWVKIFSGDQEARQRILPGKPTLLVVGETRICLTLYNNQFYAVQDACTHNGESLSKGHVNYLGEIICPWHNYQFDMQTGRECQLRSRDLRTFPVKIDESGFFIAL